MFQRYTEHARRAIFFARFEASNLGSGWNEPEHLLLGLMREDRVLPSSLTVTDREEIRKQIELRFPDRNPSPFPPISPSAPIRNAR